MLVYHDYILICMACCWFVYLFNFEGIGRVEALFICQISRRSLQLRKGIHRSLSHSRFHISYVFLASLMCNFQLKWFEQTTLNAGPLEAFGHRNTFGKIINHAAGSKAVAGSKTGERGSVLGYEGSAYMNRIGNRRQEAATESVDSARGRREGRGQVSLYFWNSCKVEKFEPHAPMPPHHLPLPLPLPLALAVTSLCLRYRREPTTNGS